MKIRIVTTPSGQAPQHIRDCWIGCEMESVGRDTNNLNFGVLDGARVTDNDGGYIVDVSEAVRALEVLDHLPTFVEAIAWWRSHMSSGSQLVFGAQYCEEVS